MCNLLNDLQYIHTYIHTYDNCSVEKVDCRGAAAPKNGLLANIRGRGGERWFFNSTMVIEESAEKIVVSEHTKSQNAQKAQILYGSFHNLNICLINLLSFITQ